MIKRNNYLNVLVWMVVLICPYLLQSVGVIETAEWAVDKNNGILSVITGSFLHSSYSHMFGNLTGMLIGISVLYNLYGNMYYKVVIPGIIIPSLLMYELGLKSVGISGLVFAVIWFVILRGLMSRNKIRFFSGIFLLVIYAGSLKTIIPSTDIFSTIAWQAHLAGVLVALVCAIYSRLR